jgi:stalled ribosome rescue protein Dom34
MKTIIELEKIGIWVDRQKAILMTIKNSETIVETIYSNLESRERVDGEGRNNNRFGDQHIDDEKGKERRLEEKAKSFYSSIISKINQGEELVIFGPAEMKHQLAKKINKDTSCRIEILGIETADSMTENQLVAWVKNYYSND